MERNLETCPGTYKLNLESFESFLDPKAPATATISAVYPGPQSYWSTTISTGSLASATPYTGWCIEDDLVLYSSTNYQALLYSSYDDDIYQNPNLIFDILIELPLNLDKLNYLLNKKWVGKPAPVPCGGTYSIQDVQQAIWKLVEGPIPTVSLDCRQAQLYNDALANGGGYVPPCGGVIAVLLPILIGGLPNKQTTIIEYPLTKGTKYCPCVIDKPYVSSTKFALFSMHCIAWLPFWEHRLTD